ncbi:MULTISPECIES: RNA 2',3'-cyclic phosphodiesterase [unclassified Sphingomonas]|uniref:RNA 2',3'-cyclic phosphodiesterase n=1 Tax=unclassified Sphingomonas TaxID=196159 RepID=UPI002150E70D|nr:MULTISPECIES: RNA 2',3'-cyclic phosphodiesterase [unclassified Sphingomonas]MCR5870878.1 RNA 2',3'-cyclic phosphodiesterase [Sphingomonas sp. J344]UUY00802.1 RNA 2',3'-cyclic phosphodiesterase [Sphingomonas sp. J315]
MHRLFVALRPPPAIRDRLTDLMDGVEGARWQGDDQLHITLRYIGEVDRRTAEDVATALSAIRFDLPPLRLDGCGTFDTKGRPNALWAGVAPRDALATLHKKIDRAMIRIGLEPEHRAYVPHITLARLAGSAGPVDGFLARHAALTSPEFTVDHMALYESRLGHGGASYEPVERYALTA